MKRWFAYIVTGLLLCTLLSSCHPGHKEQKYTDYSFDCFDTVTTIIGYETSEELFLENCKLIKEKLTHYHKLFDIYRAYDGLTNFYSLNHSAGECVTVDREILDLLLFSSQIHQQTDGAVNVAMGSVLSLWHDCRGAALNDPQSAQLPSWEHLSRAAEHTDFEDIMMDEQANTVTLIDPDLRLDVGAVAKGFAIEQVAQWMYEEGMEGYLLNVGGNVRCIGAQPDGSCWIVGIEDPNAQENHYLELLSLSDMSVATSGDYQRFYTVNEKNFHHIIDPDTLYPAEGFRSVSVICLDAALADALSTALFCMSWEEGISLIGEYPDVHAMWVFSDGSQQYSQHFQDYCIQ